MIKTIQKLDLKSINQAIITQQIVFKREFSVLVAAVKTEYVPHLEEKIQTVLKRDYYRKNPEKKSA